ncbi:MAG: hypothetical protein H6735_11590 [Alphaproteobacteria bacterium]|nr:hypothetical protein [Alphaproteobacteria bacterium]
MSVAPTLPAEAPAGPPGLAASLGGAWDLLRTDPVGLLLPTGGCLLVDVVAAMVLREALVHGATPAAFALIGGWVARTVLGAPLRSRMLAVAARARGHRAPPWGRPLAVLGAELVVGPASLGIGGVVGAVGVLAAALVLSEGWVATASVILAIGTVAGVALALLVRACFATAGLEAAVAGASGLGSLRDAITAGPRTIAISYGLLVIGGTLTGVGALACGALLLPGYPIADLAIADRWLAERRSG